jgi:hypothetical protein
VEGLDIARLEVSPAGSGSWFVLADNQPSPPGKGGLLDDGTWHTAVFPLHSLTGTGVDFRFTFDSVNALQNGFRGFIVDNVLIRNLPENAYFLAVAKNVTLEGPYGRDSAGRPRPGSANACVADHTNATCP